MRFFEWDDAKAAANLRKHGVSSDEATTIFSDWAHVTTFDRAHSTYEERFITIGESEHGRLLLVSHADTERTIRIISAREALRAERKRYEEESAKRRGR